jgi:hypothetical protein
MYTSVWTDTRRLRVEIIPCTYREEIAGSVRKLHTFKQQIDYSHGIGSITFLWIEVLDGHQKVLDLHK